MWNAGCLLGKIIYFKNIPSVSIDHFVVARLYKHVNTICLSCCHKWQKQGNKACSDFIDDKLAEKESSLNTVAFILQINLSSTSRCMADKFPVVSTGRDCSPRKRGHVTTSGNTLTWSDIRCYVNMNIYKILREYEQI